MFDFKECKKFIKKCERKGISIQWSFIATSFELPIEFILEHENELDFDYLYRYQHWDENTLRIFQDKIPWNQVDPNVHSKEFCREFKDKFKFGFWFLSDDLQKEFGDPENYDTFWVKLKNRKWLEENGDWFK